MNGLDVAKIEEICEGIQQDPESAKAQFRVKNTWVSGGNNQITVDGFYGAKEEQKREKGFQFEADEPPILLGKDQGANPVEYLLTALSSCMTTSIAFHAAAKGIEIHSMRSEFKGDLDLQGFLNLSQDVPIGYKNIEATFFVKTDGDVSELEKFYKLSPVYNTVSKAVPVTVKFIKE